MTTSLACGYTNGMGYKHLWSWHNELLDMTANSVSTGQEAGDGDASQMATGAKPHG